MGLYNVVTPCVVNDLHYVRPTTQPIEVDDDTAPELVESGCLTPYLPAAGGVYEIPGKTGDILDGVLAEVVDPPVTEPKPRTRRRGSED